MPRHEEPKESSVARLARDFMRRTQRDGRRGKARNAPFDLETVMEEGVTRKARYANPVNAGTLGLLVWGSGFIYMGHPFLASVALVLLLISGSLFAALSGILPFWIGNSLLKDLHWEYPLGPSLLVCGAILSMIWWLSVIAPTWMAVRRLPGRYQPSDGRLRLLTAACLPMVGHFTQGKFWRGTFFGIVYFWLPISAASAWKLWSDSTLQPLLDVTRTEPYFIASVLLFAFSFVVVLAALWDSLTGALDRIGWLRSCRDGTETEWKFVLLGGLLTLAVLTYGFVGRPGDRTREKIGTFSGEVEARGFSRSARLLRSGARAWDRGAATIKDRFPMFQ